MVSIRRVVAISLILYLVDANFTRISRDNVLLSRKKRYLNFPVGSNFVITLSLIKFLLQVQPRGWAILLEADVPTALPSDTRQFKRMKRHANDRRNLLEQVEDAMTGIGLNGVICAKRIICAVLQHKGTRGKSLVKDILYAAFVYPEDYVALQRDNCNDPLTECSLPLLESLLENVFVS